MTVNADDAVEGDRRVPTKGERQRRAMLDSLASLLTSGSIHDVTVAEVAAGAGAKRSNFYFYFDSKYAALAVLTSEIWAELMDRADAFVRFDQESVADFLARTSGITVDTWHRHEAVLVASIQAIPVDDQLAAMWTRWSGRLADLIIEQVERDRRSGGARPATEDVHRLVSTLLEMTLHIFYRDRLDRADAVETAAMLDTVRAIWLTAAWGIDPNLNS